MSNVRSYQDSLGEANCTNASDIHSSWLDVCQAASNYPERVQVVSRSVGKPLISQVQEWVQHRNCSPDLSLATQKAASDIGVALNMADSLQSAVTEVQRLIRAAFDEDTAVMANLTKLSWIPFESLFRADKVEAMELERLRRLDSQSSLRSINNSVYSTRQNMIPELERLKSLQTSINKIAGIAQGVGQSPLLANPSHWTSSNGRKADKTIYGCKDSDVESLHSLLCNMARSATRGNLLAMDNFMSYYRPPTSQSC